MMINNPFVTVGDIPEEYFCDREKETAKIIRSLTNGSNIVVMSPRRMGKSKLILHTFKQPELKDNYLSFYIDLLHTSSLRDFTYEFGISVFRRLSSIGFDAATGLPTFTLEPGRVARPEFTLKEIFEWLESAEIPCIVCFDEFQRINDYPDNKKGEVEALLRGYIQHLANTHFIFSGSERHLLLEMFHSSAKPFYNSADQLDLLPIPEDVYYSFAARNFKVFGKQLDIEALKPFYTKLEGTTYYLQRLLHEAYIDCKENEKCSGDLLQSSFEYILEEASENYRKVLGSLTERQKDTLYAIAREKEARKIMSVAFIKKYALETPSVVQTAVKKLIDDDIITHKEGTYTVSDVLFRLFLLR